MKPEVEEFIKNLDSFKYHRANTRNRKLGIGAREFDLATLSEHFRGTLRVDLWFAATYTRTELEDAFIAETCGVQVIETRLNRNRWVPLRLDTVSTTWLRKTKMEQPSNYYWYSPVRHKFRRPDLVGGPARRDFGPVANDNIRERFLDVFSQILRTLVAEVPLEDQSAKDMAIKEVTAIYEAASKDLQEYFTKKNNLTYTRAEIMRMHERMALNLNRVIALENKFEELWEENAEVLKSAFT